MRVRSGAHDRLHAMQPNNNVRRDKNMNLNPSSEIDMTNSKRIAGLLRPTIEKVSVPAIVE
jgi:hypothetical protein